MSSRKLKKYLDRPLMGRQSKVRYLKDQINSFPESVYQIEFISKPGKTWVYWYHWFVTNFHYRVNL